MQKVVYAKLKNCLISAQKVRLVADLIRGKSVDSSIAILQFTNKTASKDVLKNLKSAIANAVNNEGMDKKDLIVKEIFVDDAPMYKRGRPAARGRYRSIIKRNSHITIGLTSIANEETKTKVKKEVKEEVKKEEKVKSVKKVSKIIKNNKK